MGIHWYARSKALKEVARQFEEVERRLVRPGADERATDAALDEREALFALEAEAREELKRRGFAVTVSSIPEWPPHVLQHVEALGPAEPDRRLLDLIGWGTDYYIENLRDAGVPMDAFSQHLDYLRASPQQARTLGEELLRYASQVRRADRTRQARVAGMWIFLWGSVDCFVEAGH